MFLHKGISPFAQRRQLELFRRRLGIEIADAVKKSIQLYFLARANGTVDEVFDIRNDKVIWIL